MFYVHTKFVMNQILVTKLEKNKESSFNATYLKSTSKKKNWFKFQFAFSMSIMIIVILCGIFYSYYLGEKEKISSNLVANYNIYKLYSTSTNNSSEEPFNGLFGIIEIPKINLYYPVFSYLTESLLKISPCKFYGDSPDKNGNICIAGHNYDNSLFFSKLSTLSQNDEIYLYDNNGIQYVYSVYDIYEVEESDLSPILNYESNEKILTLVTCNNFNANRIILKAKQKKLF